MKYFLFHLGDWITSTHLLTATERGVYLDFLTQYYSNEMPITQTEYKRITRVYTQAEQEAAKVILAEFFDERDGVFYHRRCEKELSASKAISEKRKKAINTRWQREKQKKAEASGGAKTDTSVHTPVSTNEADLNNRCNTPITPLLHYSITERESRERAPAKPTRTADANPPTPTPKRLTPPEGIPAQAWSDWMQVRGNAPVTKSFWKDFCNNADKLHLTPAKAVELCAQRGWKRLDADWESVKVAESNEDRLLRLMGEA